MIGQLDAALVDKGYFHPPERAAGDPQHHPHHLHQDRLVVARGQGGARDYSGAGRLGAAKGLIFLHFHVCLSDTPGYAETTGFMIFFRF